MPPLGGPHRDTATTFGTKKLEWSCYSVVKISEDTITRFERIHERDERTDRRTGRQTVRHCMMAQTALA